MKTTIQKTKVQQLIDELSWSKEHGFNAQVLKKQSPFFHDSQLIAKGFNNGLDYTINKLKRLIE